MSREALKKLTTNAIMIMPFVLFLFLRLDGIIGDMSNSDAARWHRRSESFSRALLSKDFAQTYQRYHPGVTLMWLSSVTEWGIKVYDRAYNKEFKTLENTDGYLVIDGASKIVLVLVLFGLLSIQFGYIQLLYDKNVALFYVFIAAVEPYFIGINRWYHLTALEVSLSFCAFLALVLWSKFGKKSYVFKCGIFFGFALLTKFSSLFLLPVLLAVFLFTIYKKPNPDKSFYLKSVLVLTLTSAAVFFAFFPAMWVTPFLVLKNILNAAKNSGAGDYSSVVYAETHSYLYYLVVLLFKLSPITIFLLLVGTVRAFRRKDSTAIFLVFYIFSQLLLLSASEQKIERYILSFLPAAFLLVAIVLSRFTKSTQKLAILVILISFAITYKNYHPFYSAYYSQVFGGPKSAYAIGIYDDNGEFFARTAYYLNSKGRGTRVFVPYNVESFSYYFKGVLEPALMLDEGYLVVSKDSRRPRPTYGINCPTIDGIINNNGLDVVTIFNCVKSDAGILD